jgi:hypothetical protein
MTDASENERIALREQRARLTTEREALLDESRRLEHSHDADALRRHSARLHRYADALHAYTVALESSTSDSAHSDLR